MGSKIFSKTINSPVITAIYGNKIALIVLNDLEPQGVLIESKEAAKSYREYFNILWDSAKPASYFSSSL